MARATVGSRWLYGIRRYAGEKLRGALDRTGRWTLEIIKRSDRANGRKSKVRAFVEHVFARQKGPMGLIIRTIGLARATVKIGLANLTYNMKRAIWLTATTAMA